MTSRADGDDIELRKKVALCGVQSYLKMLMMDNFIHADLHPGNVLVRMEEVGWVARLQRYLLIGQTGERVPHIVFLDAGLAASFNTRIYSNVQVSRRRVGRTAVRSRRAHAMRREGIACFRVGLGVTQRPWGWGDPWAHATRLEGHT